MDLKLPGGMYSHHPSDFTVTNVLKALLNSAEAELNIKMSAIQILIESQKIIILLDLPRMIEEDKCFSRNNF